jgi:hypothetical protein
MPYQVKKLDLSALIVGKELVPPGQMIRELSCLDVVGGAVFNLKLGIKNNDYFEVTKGFAMAPRGEIDANGGLYVTNDVAQPGQRAQLIVVFGEGAGLQPVL